MEYAFRVQGVGKQMKSAAATGARRAVIVGPDERAQGVVVVRTLETGVEERVAPEALVARGEG